MGFKKENKLGHGGAREGAGRKPSEWWDRVNELADRPEIMTFLEDIVTGRGERVYFNQKTGKEVRIPIDVKDRLECIREIWDRAKGKPTQNLKAEVKGDCVVRLPVQDMGEAGKVVDTSGENCSKT